MCIIVCKNKSAPLPKLQYLKNCFDNNPDGMGFMYTDKGKVIIDKGYMTQENFLHRYFELCDKYDDFKNKSLVMHFRIGTSSANSPQNTHPYPITRKAKLYHKLYVETDIGIAHNGIIHDYTPKNRNDSMNDTQYFIRDYLAPLYENYKEFYKNKHIMDGIKEITGSKFCILTPDDNVYFIGEFIKDEKISYSNDTFEYSWYNRYTYGDYIPSHKDTLEYLPSDATVILSDGYEVKVGTAKLQLTYDGELYEVINGKPSLIDIDAMAIDKNGECIYTEGGELW